MTSSAVLQLDEQTTDTAAHTLLVTWQDSETRRYHAVGLLRRHRGGHFQFSYLGAAAEVTGFRPFLGFSDLGRTYVSSHLFPLFAERVLNDGRPDRMVLYGALDLASSAGPMEFLARSGGQRAGDRIQVLPVPAIEGSRTSCVFLVHGVRHLPGAAAAIDRLLPGHRLGLQPQPDNPVNGDAVLVTSDGTRLGWVPDPLLGYVRAVMGSGDARLTVVRANPPELGHHLRLLVRLDGSVPVTFTFPWAEDLAVG